MRLLIGMAITGLLAAACGGEAVVEGAGGTTASGAGGGGTTSSTTGNATTSSTGVGGGPSTSTGVGGGDAGAYSAMVWFGGLDHFILSKTDVERDICIRLFADAPTMGSPDYAIDTTMPWGVNTILAWDSAMDCDDWMNGPQGPAISAPSAKGTLGLFTDPGKFLPCEAKVDVEVAFNVPWLDATEMLTAEGVKVVDCPN